MIFEATAQGDDINALTNRHISSVWDDQAGAVQLIVDWGGTGLPHVSDLSHPACTQKVDNATVGRLVGLAVLLAVVPTAVEFVTDAQVNGGVGDGREKVGELVDLCIATSIGRL